MHLPQVLPKMGITATVIDPSDMKALEACLEQHEVSLFFSESPTNPYLRCVDVKRISQLCHAKGALVCIDSTFATPINQRAIEFGADIVIHSATKYLGGHNDVLGGKPARPSPLQNRLMLQSRSTISNAVQSGAWRGMPLSLACILSCRALTSIPLEEKWSLARRSHKTKEMPQLWLLLLA